MCGIAGLVGLPVSVAEPRVRLALQRLTHRGPDGEGLHIEDGAVVGMRRLAIIDVATGDQPIYNEDRSIAAVCNGEIYNYVEGFRDLERRGHRLQSHSDVNLVPHYYEELGTACFTRLRGMFAIAIWDARRRRLTLTRDRVGKKPLFWATVPGGLAFASELPALLALLPTTPPLAPRALADYLQLGVIPQPDTIYAGVHALPPGTALSMTVGSAPTLETWWTPPPMETAGTFRGDLEDALAALDAAFSEAVRLRLRSDVPVGLFLSGGIDSGLVAAYARAAGATDLLCFVVEVDDPALNEGPLARRTADHLGLPVQTIPLSFAPRDAIFEIPRLYGQPFGDSSALPSFFVAQAARAHRKVVLNGDGGDEVFAGYRRYWLGRQAPWLVPLTAPFRPLIGLAGDALAHAATRRSSLGFAARALRGLAVGADERYLRWTGDLLSAADVAHYFPELASHGPVLPRLAEIRGERMSADGLHRFLRSDYRLILPDGLIPKMDIATMANSVEARSPFLDIPLAELAWTFPDRWLLHHGQTKPLLRALARRHLPDPVVRAPKRGFEVPVARWLAQDLRDVVGDLLLSPASRVSAMGNAGAIRTLVSGTDGFAGNRPQTIWCLLILELFLRGATSAPAA